MPRVPQVSVPRVSVPTVSPGFAPDPRGAFTAEAFGAGVGRAMAGAGQALASLGAEFVERQERIDSIDASNKLVMFGEEYNQWYENAEREWDPKGTGFADNAMNTYNEKAAEFIQTIPEKQRPEITNRLLRLRGAYSGRALNTQYGMQDKYSEKSIEVDVGRAADNVARSPALLAQEKEGTLANINASTLSESKKEAHRQVAQRALEASALKTERMNQHTFRSRLVTSESSGIVNKVNTLGYAGLYQFGAPRLAHLGLYRPGGSEPMGNWSKTGKNAPGKWSGQFNIPGHPEVRTIQDFLHNKAAQETAYNIHQNKMDQEISSMGLDRYEGQTVGGVKITRSALYGMMHLGGAGGAKRFLESGGRSSSRDAYGTGVGAYGRKFSGQATDGTTAGPTRVDNANGTYSTERTIGIESGGKHYNIPTLVAGVQKTPDEAIELWRSGQNPEVGVFDTQEEADAAAAQRSEAGGADSEENIADEMRRAAEKANELEDDLWKKDERYSHLTDVEKDKIDKDARIEAKKIEDAAKQQHNTYVNSMYNDLALRIYDGKAGRAEIDAARQSWLTDFDKIVRLDNLLAQRDKDQLTYEGAVNEINTRNDWTQFNSEDKKKLNAVFDAEAGRSRMAERDPAFTQRLIEIAARTKMAPQGAVEILRGSLESGDPKKVDYAMSLALRMMQENPGIFAGHENGKAVEDNAAKYAFYLGANFSPAEASAKIVEQQTPEYKAKVESLMKGKDVDDELNKSIKVSDLENAFGSWVETDPSVGVDPRTRDSMMTDFAMLTKDYYLENGNIDEAKRLAVERLKKSWGVTRIGGANNIVRFAPENAPAYAIIPESERSQLMTADVIEAVKAQTGLDVKPNQIKLLPVPYMHKGATATRDLYWTSEAPPYIVQFQDANGIWHSLPRPGVFEPKALQERLSAQRQAKFEEEQKRLQEENLTDTGGLPPENKSEPLPRDPKKLDINELLNNPSGRNEVP